MANIKNIFIKNEVTEDILQPLEMLTAACNHYDNSALSFDMKNRPIEKPCDFFYIADNRLVGYLGLYPHYIKGIINLKGIVHPDYRRKGVFTALFESAKASCIQRGFTNLILITDRASESGRGFSLSLGASLKYSNYDMELDFHNFCYKNHPIRDITFRLAESHDIDCIVALGMQGFGTTEEEERPIIETSMKDSSLDVYVVEYYNTVVGTGTVIRKKDETVICGLVVEQRHRGKGIGKKMLTEIVQHTIDKVHNKIILSVDAENLNALTLYEKCGFKAINAVDFYDLKLQR